MRILAITRRLALIGGAERSQASVLAALSARGHDVFVLHEPDVSEAVVDWGAFATLCEVPRLQISGRDPVTTVQGFGSAMRRARALRPDIVYSFLHYQLPTALLVARMSRAPLVHHARVPADAVALRRRYWWPLSQADKVIFISNFTASEYVSAGFDERRGVVIHNGIDVESFAPLSPLDRHAFRRSLGFSDDEVILVFAGRSSLDKGLGMLADALSALAPDRRIRCLMLTNQELTETPAGREIATRLAGLGSLMMPWRSDVQPFVAAADIAIVPSQWPEPFGRSVVEPMSCGVPVIATRVGGIPEILVGELDRFLVEPGDVSGLVGRIRHHGTWRTRSPGLGAILRKYAREHFPLGLAVHHIEDEFITTVRRHQGRGHPHAGGGDRSLGRPPSATTSVHD